MSEERDQGSEIRLTLPRVPRSFARSKLSSQAVQVSTTVIYIRSLHLRVSRHASFDQTGQDRVLEAHIKSVPNTPEQSST